MMPVTKQPPRRALSQFSVEKKLLAIHRVNDGESKASVARDIGVPESTLRGWCKSEAKLRSSCESENNPLLAEGCLDLAAKRPRLSEPQQRPPQQPKEAEVDAESLLVWLRHQQFNGQLLASGQLAAAAVANTPAIQNHNNGWFWRWYKEFGLGHTTLAATPVPVLSTPSHVNRQPEPAHSSSQRALTPASASASGAANLSLVPRVSPVVVPAQPDEPSDDEDEEITAADAVEHGEKLLRWLDCCSDPQITAFHILQFRYLLNNVRRCALKVANASK